MLAHSVRWPCAIRDPRTFCNTCPHAGEADGGKQRVDDRLARWPDGLESTYELGRVDPAVELSTAEIELAGTDHTVRLEPARVFITSSPNLALRFEGSVENPGVEIIGGPLGTWEPAAIVVPELGIRGSLPVAPEWSGSLGGQDTELIVSGRLGLLESNHCTLREVRFLLPNFPAFIGDFVRRRSTASRCRLEFAAADWLVTLDGRDGLRELSGELRSGAYAFTHIGRLARADGAPFDSEAAAEVLEGLHWFLSFVRGAWSGPLILDGYATDGELCWRKWSVGRTDRWSGAFTWCDTLEHAAAQQAFRGFMTNWATPFTNSVMRVGIGTYVTANNPNPVETAIITAQSGLELLGWLRFVESGKTGRDDWKRKGASEKITDLLRLGSIDTSIPTETSALIGLLPDWKTGPQVVAGVRNRLVHPSQRDSNAGWSGEVLADAWLLSSRYLELCLLHLLGVEAPIRDRLGASQFTGSVAPPPWA
jgi:hypothetical protein